jgi:hypothetical protein
MIARFWGRARIILNLTFGTLLLLIGQQGTSFAQNPAPSFQYKIDNFTLANSSPLQAYQMSKWFASQGYRALSSRSVLSKQLHFDFAFVGANLEKALLLKSGLRAPAEIMNTVLTDEKSKTTVFHFEMEGTPYVLVAMNLSSSELKDLVRPWLKQKQTASLKWRLLIGEQAHAIAPVCGSWMANQMKETLSKTASHIDANEMLQSIGRCSAQALDGISSSVSDSLDFFKKLATDPSALWTEMKDSFIELKNFALNIQEELGPALDAVAGLTTEQKTQMACTLAGKLVASAAQAFVSGAALAKALPMMLLKLKQTTATLVKMARLEKLGINFGNKSKLAEEVIACGI